MPGWTSTIFAIDCSQWLVSHDLEVLALRRLPDPRSRSLVQLVFHLEGHLDPHLPSRDLVRLDQRRDVLDMSGVDAVDRDAGARDCQLHGVFDRVGRDARELDRFFNHDAQTLLGTQCARDCLTLALTRRYARPCTVVS